MEVATERGVNADGEVARVSWHHGQEASSDRLWMPVLKKVLHPPELIHSPVVFSAYIIKNKTSPACTSPPTFSLSHFYSLADARLPGLSAISSLIACNHISSQPRYIKHYSWRSFSQPPTRLARLKKSTFMSKHAPTRLHRILQGGSIPQL